MKHPVTLIPGDGIGPEITRSVKQVIEAAGVEIEWHEQEAGGHAIEQYGTQVPEHVLNCIRADRVCLKGPVTTPIGTGFTSANVILRKTLDLYANLRPVRSLPGVKSRFEKVDVVVVRENTEGLYSGIEHVVVPGVVESLKIVTERASTRIAEFAFEYAKKTGRGQVTAVHKANIMKLTDGMSLTCARRVAARYPEIKYTEQIVDAACMKLVMDPQQYEVLVMENLYGDIVSDLCAGLVGGLGVVPGANLGSEYAVFEAVHGSAPDIAGKNMANPTAIILSAVMMLHHIGEDAAADRIEAAVRQVLAKGEQTTPDLGGHATTTEMTEAIIASLEG
jgi:isocitrate dehydrogenase (NAD+)